MRMVDATQSGSVNSPSTMITVRLVANGASTSSPQIHSARSPLIHTRPPVGLRGRIAIGRCPSAGASRTPMSRNAVSSGPIGRRPNWCWPTMVTGDSARLARPVSRYSVVLDPPTDSFSARSGR